MMKTKSEILDEMVSYYSEDVSRRAVEDGACMYYIPESGKMCAVGRCLENPQNFTSDDGLDAVTLLEMHGMEVLKPEYRGHGYSFWEDLQVLHDSDRFWTETGLNERGLEYLQSIKDSYGDM